MLKNPDRMTDQERMDALRASGWPAHDRKPFVDTLWLLFILMAILLPAGHVAWYVIVGEWP
jgi:hypothetical protein